jgi:hypothetical protein
MRTGSIASGLPLLDDALAESREPIQRAAIEHVRGRILVLQGRGDAATQLLIDTAQGIRAVDPERADDAGRGLPRPDAVLCCCCSPVARRSTCGPDAGTSPPRGSQRRRTSAAR